MLKAYRWKTCLECPFADRLRRVCEADEDVVPNLDPGMDPPDDCPFPDEDEIDD